MTFNNENLPIFYPNIPTQNDSYNYGVYCSKYIKMLYQHRQWNFLYDTSSAIVAGLSAIMKFQNPEAMHLLRVSIKKGIKLLSRVRLNGTTDRDIIDAGKQPWDLIQIRCRPLSHQSQPTLHTHLRI